MKPLALSLSLALAAVAISIPAPAADCVDYGAGLQLLARLDLEHDSSETDVALRDDHAYVATYRLVVADVADPEHPAVVHVSYEGGWAGPESVDVDGDRLVVGVGNHGVEIYTLGVPTDPTLRFQHTVAGHVNDVDVHGDIVFVATQTSGVHVLDLGGSGPPEAIANIAFTNARGIDASGDFLYVHGSPLLRVYDVGDPAAPILRYEWNHSVVDVDVRGDRVYAARGHAGAAVFRPNTLGALELLGTFNPGGYVTFATGDGEHAYLVHGSTITCVHAPAGGPFVAIDELTTPQDPAMLAFHRGIAYGPGWSHLDVFDLGNPGGANALLGSQTTTEDDERGAVAGRDGWAYVVNQAAAGGALLEILDVGDPTTPVQVGAVALGEGLASSVALGAAHAYVADGAGIAVVDIADPPDAALVGHATSADPTLDLAIAGDRLHVAEGAGGLAIYSVAADPTAPQLLGRYAAPWLDADAVAVAGDLAVLYTEDHRVVTVDVGDPAAPSFRGELGGLNGVFARRIALDGHHAYAGGLHTVWVVDVSETTAPELATAVEIPGIVRDVTVAGGTLYVAAGYGGLHAVDVTWPATAHVLGSLEAEVAPFGVAVSDDLVLLGAKALLGIAPAQCRDVTGAARPLPDTASGVTVQAAPNPFNPTTTIHYALPAAGPISVAVFDPRGRRVRTLVAGEDRSAGAHAVTWDGRDARGRGVASGVYLVRVATPGRVAVGKVGVVR